MSRTTVHYSIRLWGIIPSTRSRRHRGVREQGTMDRFLRRVLVDGLSRREASQSDKRRGKTRQKMLRHAEPNPTSWYGVYSICSPSSSFNRRSTRDLA